MKLFEYNLRALHMSQPVTTSKILNELGREGWELVMISEGVGCFKREIVEQQVLNEGFNSPLQSYYAL